MRSSLMTIPNDHPSLSGHFPNEPIVPGVVILDTVIRFAQQGSFRVTGIENVKFKAPLHPDAPFHVELSPYPGRVDFRVVTGNTPLAHGTLRCRDRVASEPK